jgi:hypothetical protein
MQRPKPGTPRSIAELFTKVIGEEYGRDYLDLWDLTYIIDLSLEALDIISNPIWILF